MMDVVKYLLEDKYDEFLAEFPQDRENRLKIAKLLVKLKMYADGKAHKAKFREHTISIRVKFKYVRYGGYDTLVLIGRTRGEYYYYADALVIFGEDDSGVWVEILDIALTLSSDDSFERIEPDKSEIDVDAKRLVIRRSLHAGEEFGGRELPLDNVKVDSEEMPMYRVQGDVNITVHPLSTIYGSTFGQSFLYGGGLCDYTLARYHLDFAREDILAVVVDYGDKRDMVKYNFINQVLRNLYSELPMIRYLYKPMNVFDFDNHKITIYNAYCVESGGELEIKTSVDDDSFIIIESPHHKTVQINLKFGFYTLSKSGGLTVAEFETTVKRLLEDSFNEVPNKWKAIANKIFAEGE